MSTEPEWYACFVMRWVELFVHGRQVNVNSYDGGSCCAAGVGVAGAAGCGGGGCC